MHQESRIMDVGARVVEPPPFDLKFNEEEFKGLIKDVTNIAFRDLIHIPLLFAVIIATIALLCLLILWKVKKGPYQPSNLAIFIGHIILVSAFVCSYESMKADRVNYYALLTMSYNLLIVSLLVSYNFAHPPHHICGFMFGFTGVLCHVISVIHRIELGKDIARISSIVGFNVFGIGITILILNLVNRLYLAVHKKSKVQPMKFPRESKDKKLD